ncbi:hypothetical protein LJC00_01760 [Dysgonomonas sp. OttesenSCG-928-M03]|nr:hypothetical protein [Dysgonomonas sp. OttesenSCG-928-M03]
MNYINILLAVFYLLTACQKTVPVAETKERAKPGNAEEVVLQPFVGFPEEFSEKLLVDIRKVFPRITLNKPIFLPDKVFRSDSSIYKADSLIAFLERKSTGTNVIIGLTDKNIGIGKYRIKQIMGLADMPGYSCVTSTYMLSQKNTYSQLYKLTLHELAHTQGVRHCRKDTTCYMSSANGDNPWDVETGFCRNCKEYLKRKGWQLD